MDQNVEEKRELEQENRIQRRKILLAKIQELPAIDTTGFPDPADLSREDRER